MGGVFPDLFWPRGQLEESDELNIKGYCELWITLQRCGMTCSALWSVKVPQNKVTKNRQVLRLDTQGWAWGLQPLQVGRNIIPFKLLLTYWKKICKYITDNSCSFLWGETAASWWLSLEGIRTQHTEQSQHQAICNWYRTWHFHRCSLQLTWRWLAYTTSISPQIQCFTTHRGSARVEMCLQVEPGITWILRKH